MRADYRQIINDCYHVMLKFQRDGVEYDIQDQMESTLAGEQMDIDFDDFRRELGIISAARAWHKLNTLNGIKQVQASGHDVVFHTNQIRAYEDIFSHMDALQAGDEYQIYKTSQWEEEHGIG